MFASSLFNRLISVNRSVRINNSFLLSVNIFCRASVGFIAVKGVKAPDTHLFINKEFKSSIADATFPPPWPDTLPLSDIFHLSPSR